MSPSFCLPEKLHHGGRLRAAAKNHHISLENWLDLSTGVNPKGWPVAVVPALVWQRLPEDEDDLKEIACAYYGAPDLLPVAGSQAAIQALPYLRSASRVAVLSPSYAEHAYGWRQANHVVATVAAGEINDILPATDVLIIVHPNNPDGGIFPIKQLLNWHAQLADRGGWLIIDEAFMDVTPEHSMVSYTTLPGLIILRSLGKFFGLAGTRVGFVCAQAALLAQLNMRLGPWSVSSPARWVASKALQDRTWQSKTRRQLIKHSARLRALLIQHQFAPEGGCGLFQWVRTQRALLLHTTLARQGILTRLFDDPLSVRFGLPETESDWCRLNLALTVVNNNQ